MTDADLFVPFGGDETVPVAFEAARVVVLPLCYEAAPSYGHGSAEGPRHLLAASAQLETLDEETLIHWGRMGIHTLPPLHPGGGPEAAVAEMKSAALSVLKTGKRLLSLGGDHAVAIGPIAAAAEVHPNLGVLQVDAHLDLRDSWNGSRFNHGCVMRRVMADFGLPAAQVGMRAVCEEELMFLRDRRCRPFWAHELDPFDDSWIGEVICALPENVYVTFDLDGLDPSVLPGTGTPEPGGLTWRQAVRLLRAVGRERTVVAADINELAKIPGSQVSEYTAAKLAVKLLIHCFQEKS